MTRRPRAELLAALLIALAAAPIAALAIALTPPATFARAGPARPETESFGALYGLQRFAAAESLARVRLADAERRAPESIAVACWLDSLAMSLYELDRHAEPATRELARRAIRIRERRLGTLNPGVVPSIVMLANLHLAASEFAPGESLLVRAETIQRRAFAAADPARAEVLNELGRARERLGRFDQAESTLAEARRVVEHAGPEADEDRLSNAYYLGSLYTSIGRYEESIRAFEEAKAITERKHGPQHPNVAASLNGIASALQRLGRYSEARPLFERLVKIHTAATGPNTSNVGSARNNLGVLLGQMGFHREALAELRAAAAIFERELGPNSMSLARALTTIGASLGDLDSLAAAVPVLERALAIKLANIGPDHPSTDLTRSNLAVIYGRLGRSAEALAAHGAVLDSRRKRLGPDHPDVAESWRQVGNAYMRLDRPDSAIAACDSGLAILLRRFDPQHPACIRMTTDLAMAFAAHGDRDSALARSLAAEDARRAHVRLTMRALSEDEAIRYAQARQPPLPIALGLASHGLDAAALARVHDAVARSRSVVLDELAERHRPAGAGEAASARANWQTAQQRLARWLVASGGAAGAALESLEVARAAALTADRELAAASPAHRAQSARDVAGLADVVRALPPNAALVSYVRAAFDDRLEHGGDAYLAFVARAGRPEVCARLGNAAHVDSLVAVWRERAGRPPHATDARGDERDCAAAGAALRAAVWDPLAGAIAGAGRVFVVPDGELALVAFHALPAAHGGYLVERGPVLQLLGSELDLLPSATTEAGAGMLALGDPDFDGAAQGPAPQLVAAAFRGERPPCDAFRSWRWSRLTGTGDEARTIAAEWDASDAAHPADVRLGGEATEAALRSLAPGHRIVHVATHGFFLDDRCHGALPGARGVGGVVRERAAPPESAAAEPNAAAGSTLRLAGLALAGANRRDASTDAADDGILTAEEVATLDLSAARWVVLSACETGVGDVQAGAGVTGLRRAFRAAGAGTLVMSLWGVSDRATLEWMRALYAAHLGRGLGAAESLRDACREVLARRRAAGDSTHPFYWGGFVATGGAD